MTFTFTYADILTLVYILVGVGLIVCIFYVILILKNITKAAEKCRQTIDMVNEIILKPLQISRIVYAKIEKIMKHTKKE